MVCFVFLCFSGGIICGYHFIGGYKHYNGQNNKNKKVFINRIPINAENNFMNHLIKAIQRVLVDLAGTVPNG